MKTMKQCFSLVSLLCLSMAFYGCEKEAYDSTSNLNHHEGRVIFVGSGKVIEVIDRQI